MKFIKLKFNERILYPAVWGIPLGILMTLSSSYKVSDTLFFVSIAYGFTGLATLMKYIGRNTASSPSIATAKRVFFGKKRAEKIPVEEDVQLRYRLMPLNFIIMVLLMLLSILLSSTVGI